MRTRFIPTAALSPIAVICKVIILLLVVPHTVNASDEAALTAAMRHNFDSLMRLQPLVADEKAFLSESNRDSISQDLSALTATANGLPALVEKAKKPNLKALAKIFSEYMTGAEKNFKEGHYDYARLQLRSMTGLCASCHTRSEGMAEFNSGDEKIMSARLSDLQKAQYFAATRRFDKALEFYEKALADSATSEQSIGDMVRVVHGYLNVSVRVKQDPKATLTFLDKVSQAKGIAEYFARDIQQWKTDLNAWKNEQKNEQKVSSKKVEESLGKARLLVARAQKLQMYPADHAADVSYLRATNYLHESLERDLNKKQRAEAYFLLAVSYNALAEPLLWDLDSLYFEACIREMPQSSQSKLCFKRLSSNIYLGYSGSAGTHIPKDEVNRLSVLRKIAF